MAILIDDLITSIEVELEAEQRTASKAANEVKFILKRASDEGRANLSAKEDVRVNELFMARDKSKKNIKGIEGKLENARKAKAEEVQEAEAARELHDTGVTRPGGDRQRATVTVGRNERTYRPDTDKKGTQFLRDVARNFLYQDPTAAHKLSQHMAEERVERSQYLERASGTGNFAGLVVPQYLTDMYAPAVAAMRPFADICNKHDLPPDGMTVNIPLLTTSSSVGLQTSENSAVSTANPNDTLLTENVQTAAGTVTLSRQAIDRGTGIDEVTMQDLFKRYATTLDSTLINQATTGLSALAGTISFTTTLNIQNLYSKILGAIAAVEANLLAQALPTHVVMYSSRWWWMTAQTSANFPFINVMGAQFPWQGGTNDPASGYDKGIRGRLPAGLGVVVDNNVPTTVSSNQDEIYVVARDECHLWEDPAAPVFIRAEQPAAANLGVLMVLYGYFAYSFRRYSGAVQKVGGTSLAGPIAF